MAELQQAVEQALTENPLLDEKTKELAEDASNSETGDTANEAPTEEVHLGETFDKLEQLDENLRENYEHEDTSFRDARESQQKKDFQETLITKRENLTDFLLFQFKFLELNEKEHAIADEILGNIDSDGYLQTSVADIATAVSATEDEVERILKMIQELDPPGIAARDLKEALLLQLERKGPEATRAIEIVTDHLPLLEKRDWKQIAKILEIDLGEVKEACELIGKLEPRPGRIFSDDESLAIVPDATVSLDEEENLKIEIHDESVPELRLNSYYRRLLRDKTIDAKTKDFLKEKMQGALNFMRALSLRKSTIHEITEEIVKAQPEFFTKGFSHLKPLRLKDIAEKLNIHESTVSRAVQAKYMVTPQGTIPYKSFFSSRLQTESGEDESQKSMMEKIRRIIDKENPAKPYSDQAIVKMLQEDGVKIARRTVAKYRDLLKILPSHMRKKK